MNSSFSLLSTPVTSAPFSLASWMAYMPEPPPAPLISTFCPGRTCPLSRMPCSAMAPPGAGPRLARRSGRRAAAPARSPAHRRTPRTRPVRCVEGHRVHLDQHLAVLRDRHLHIRQPEHARRPIPRIDNGLHSLPPQQPACPAPRPTGSGHGPPGGRAGNREPVPSFTVTEGQTHQMTIRRKSRVVGREAADRPTLWRARLPTISKAVTRALTLTGASYRMSPGSRPDFAQNADYALVNPWIPRS